MWKKSCPLACARAWQVICSECLCHPESTITPSFSMRGSPASACVWQSCTGEIFHHKVDPKGTKVGLQDFGLGVMVSCAPVVEEGWCFPAC